MASSSALFELATIYYACRDADTLLKTFAARTGATLNGRGVLVWLSGDEGGLTCRARWFEPGERFDPVPEEVEDGVLGAVAEDGETRIFSVKQDDAAEITHLQAASRARVKSALYAGLPGARGIIGVVEVLNRRTGEFTAEEASFVEEACRITAQAFEILRGIEEEREGQFSTIERLTALYDISRIFNSTLELEELLPIIAEKIRDMLRAQACHVWLVSGEDKELYLARRAGEDPTTPEEARLPMGEGLQGKVAELGAARLVEDAAQEELLATRRKSTEEFTLTSVMCAPLKKEQEVVGIIEVVNKLDGSAFNEDDLFTLTSVCEQAAVALHNANLLQAERKVHVLDALLRISREITSTLDLDHVLTTVVNQAATVVPFDQCVIGYFDRGRFVLGAVSGEAEVPKTREMDELRAILDWAASQAAVVSADEYEEGWQTSPEESKDRLVPFLKGRGYSGFYALPLRDEQGRIGVLALLSGDAEFLNDQQRETANILANQTAIAIRNAELYQHLPLGSFLKPFAEKKKQLMKLPHSRWLEIGWRVVLAGIALTVVPWAMRISATTTVVPAERRVVSAEVGGVIRNVLVREGDSVVKGQVLAQLDDGADRVKLAQAQANLGLARRDLAEAEFRRDLTVAGQSRLREQMFLAEANLEQTRVEAAKLRAPINGLVVTQKVEEKVGKLLNAGDLFCELVDQERMAVEMNVPESEVELVRPGAKVRLKMNSFPTETFSGNVQRVGAKTTTAEGEQFFVVRALFNNPGGRVRDGMAGRGKIVAHGGPEWFESGWYPVGYVLLRTPFHWIWQKAWLWMP